MFNNDSVYFEAVINPVCCVLELGLLYLRCDNKELHNDDRLTPHCVKIVHRSFKQNFYVHKRYLNGTRVPKYEMNCQVHTCM